MRWWDSPLPSLQGQASMQRLLFICGAKPVYTPVIIVLAGIPRQHAGQAWPPAHADVRRLTPASRPVVHSLCVSNVDVSQCDLRQLQVVQAVAGWVTSCT